MSVSIEPLRDGAVFVSAAVAARLRRCARALLTVAAWGCTGLAVAGSASLGSIGISVSDTDLGDGIAAGVSTDFLGGKLLNAWVLEQQGYEDSGYLDLNPYRSDVLDALGSHSGYDADGGMFAANSAHAQADGDLVTFQSAQALDSWQLTLAPHTALTLTVEGHVSGSGHVALQLGGGGGFWSDGLGAGSRLLQVSFTSGDETSVLAFSRVANASLTPSVSAVPEPASGVLLVVGLAALAVAARRRARSAV